MIDEPAALRAERQSLHDTLTRLDPDDWRHPSLCEGWTVHDVATHASLGLELGIGETVIGLVRARGDFDRFMRAAVARRGDRSVADQLARSAAFARSAKTPPGIKLVDQGIDAFVHHHDVAVPLGRAVPSDPARLRWLADGMVGASRFIGSAPRVAGLQLVATDIDWHYGTGPTVTGPAAALIVAATGRRALDEQLEGPGLVVLAER